MTQNEIYTLIRLKNAPEKDHSMNIPILGFYKTGLSHPESHREREYYFFRVSGFFPLGNTIIRRIIITRPAATIIRPPHRVFSGPVTR